MGNIAVMFIGGPTDGERRAVKAYGLSCEPPRVYVVHEFDPIASIAIAPEYEDCAIKPKEHLYHRELFSSQGGKDRWVYVHDTMRGCDLLDVLLAGYRQPVEA